MQAQLSVYFFTISISVRSDRSRSAFLRLTSTPIVDIAYLTKTTHSCMGQKSEIILTCKILYVIILKKYNLLLSDLTGLLDFLIVKKADCVLKPLEFMHFKNNAGRGKFTYWNSAGRRRHNCLVIEETLCF